jgi:hypothetical protein
MISPTFGVLNLATLMYSYHTMATSYQDLVSVSSIQRLSNRHDASRYESFVQDGIRIYYSPKLGRVSDTLELDYVRMLFHSKPIMSGPEELLAGIIMARMNS